MNLRYRIHPEDRLALVTCFGMVTPDLFIEGMERITRDPLWQDGFGEVWDCTEITDSAISKTELARVGRMDQQYAGVVGASAMVFSSFRLRALATSYFALFPMNRPTRVFSDLDQAIEWTQQQVAPPGSA
jgi:hypothetical protein